MGQAKNNTDYTGHGDSPLVLLIVRWGKN